MTLAATHPLLLGRGVRRPAGLVLGAFALTGWLLFVYAASSAASLQATQRDEVNRLQADRARMQVQLDRKVENDGRIEHRLAEVRAQLAAAGDDLHRTEDARDQAAHELTSMRTEIESLRHTLVVLREQVATTDTVEKTGSTAAGPSKARPAKTSAHHRKARRHKGRRSRSK